MSLPIQETLSALLSDSVKKPQIIIEIDGLPTFGSTQIGKYAAYDMDGLYYDLVGLVYDGIIPDNSSYPYIDVSKSTQSITQQMLVDKGGFSSITSFDVSLVDKDGLITEFITPNNTVEDILSKKARCYLSLEGAGHPKDSVMFFSGIVAGVSSGAGYVNINLASPEKLKNLELFTKVSAETTAVINSSQTTIPVNSTSDFTLPADSGTLRTYIKIEDEIIEYTGKTDTSFTGCVRAQYDTIAVTHPINTNVESAYRLAGNLKDLSLKLMLSGINDYYLKDFDILGFNTYGIESVNNAIFVSKFNFTQYYGTVSGDIVNITGAANPSNNGLTTVSSIISSDLGSYIVLNKTLITEGNGAKFSLKSKYALLPIGLEMDPDQVDVQEFEDKFDQFSNAFFDYDFFITESVNGNEFINTQLLYPSGAYSLPRKAKTSMGLTIPPLAQYETKVLDESNVTNASGLKITRNISNNFYNSIIVKYDKSATTEKYLRGRITQSATSTNRIKIANKPLQIVSDGIRNESTFVSKFSTISRRFLERYQFGAESIENVEVQFGVGFSIEIGDTVILKGLNISDVRKGNATRDFQPRLFEVQNKVLNLKGNSIKLTLVDTAFDLNKRYGVISPSSKIGTGSTTTELNLVKSYGTNLKTRSENFKWTNLVGSKVKVFATDYSFSEETTIVSLNPANENGIIVDPPLSVAPPAGHIVQIINYPANADAADQSLSKGAYVYFNNSILVTAGINNFSFSVSAGDLADIKVGYLVRIHNEDYSRYSGEAVVTDITGLNITVDSDLTFVPALNDRIELLGFLDNGSPYTWL